MKKAHRYKLYYLADGDDSMESHYESDQPVKVGDVILLETGFYHHVRSILAQKTQVRLSVAESSQTAEEAPHMPP